MQEKFDHFCVKKLLILSQNNQIFKKVEIFGIFDHFLNAEKISICRLFNKIVNNFVKKVVKSG